MKIIKFTEISLFIIIISGFRECYTQDFSYEGNFGPDHWREYYTTCDGKYQSPINIDIHQVQKISLPSLQMTGFDTIPDIAYIRNNGHTVQVTMDFSILPTISGGPLNDTYEFAQFHYHWGDNDTYGSEDTIDNQSFPIELHIVFYKTEYNKFENAINFPDGIVVLAYFYQVSNNKNEFYDELLSLLENIIYPGNQTKFLNGPMIRDLTTNDTEHYFTYTGSLTTPPCSEVVTWIDFTTPIPISSEQISKFRILHDNEGHQLTHNYRPIQPLNGRIIYENIPKKDNENNHNDETKSTNNINDLGSEIFVKPSQNKNPHNNNDNEDDIDRRVKNKFNKEYENSAPKTPYNNWLVIIILIKSTFHFFK